MLVTVYVIIPLMSKRYSNPIAEGANVSTNDESLPSFWASIAGPLVVIALLAMRPLVGIAIDPLIALPVGGIVGICATRQWSRTAESISYGLEKMSVVAVLLVATGAIAGIIKASSLTDALINYYYAQAWDGKLPTYMGGEGGTFPILSFGESAAE